MYFLGPTYPMVIGLSVIDITGPKGMELFTFLYFTPVRQVFGQVQTVYMQPLYPL